MTLAYWDSSAFLKLLVDEVGSEDAEQVWNDGEPAVASRLVVPEVSAALAAAHRAARLDRHSHRTAIREWTRLQGEVEIVELTAEISSRAADLAVQHPLSGADSVHLASAMSFGEGPPLVVTWDRRLASAAAQEGLPVVPIP